MKTLTDAQRHNLNTIREAGGVVEHDRHGFHKPGEKECIRGMNAVAVRSLVKLGRLTITASAGRDTIAISSKPTLTPSHVAALKWQRERFGGEK